MSEADARSLERFLADEAALLDRGAFDEWLQLFAPDGTYWVPAAEGQADPFDHVSLFFENEAARTGIRKLPFDMQSEVYLSRALHILSLGHIVITDRLLAHVLCLLLGIPHVLINDETGKNWHFHETWTREASLCRLARTPAEAWSIARNAAPKAKERGVATSQWTWD